MTRHGPDLSALVLDDGPRARCSLWWTGTPTLEGAHIGYIGHYAALDAGSGREILTWACRRLAEAGCARAIAPIDGNTWRRYRLLTERGAEPPFFLEPDNPDDMPEHFAAAGFRPLADYFSSLNNDLAIRDPRAIEAEQRLEKAGIRIRPLDPTRFHEELRAVHAVSLTAFPQNFLYAPISEEEFVAMYAGLEKQLRPELVLLAEAKDRVVGFLFAIPDLAQAARGQPIDTMIAKSMAVLPEYGGLGLGGVLMERAHAAGRALGYRRSIHALMHQDNRSRRLSSRTAHVIRRYTLYERMLRHDA